MLPHMLGLRHDREIIRMIVLLILVDVVDNFASVQWSTKFFLCNYTMFMAAKIFDVALCLPSAPLCGSIFFGALASNTSVEFRPSGRPPNA